MQSVSSEAVQGQQQSWNLIKKLGEGDAGEVFLVESFTNNQLAILKRPRKSSFFSDIMRQARQIDHEGNILRGLGKASFPIDNLEILIPKLIDQNKPEYGLSEQTFIIIEQAKGLSLKLLWQLIKFGLDSIDAGYTSPEATFAIQQWSKFQSFPEPLMVRILLGVTNFLEKVHSNELRTEKGKPSGVIWNDVKPDHLYWNPLGVNLTVIDWGNSQFLESDGITKDRQYAAQDDFHQLIQEMGGFLSEAMPELYSRLEWPESSIGGDIVKDVIQSLKQRLMVEQEAGAKELKALRQQEGELYAIPKPGIEQIRHFSELQQSLSAFGELPDSFSAVSFLVKAAYTLAAEYRLEEFRSLCEIAARLPSSSVEKWNLLGYMADIAQKTTDNHDVDRTIFTNALTDGVADDWGAALWELVSFLGDVPRSEWWEKLSQRVRIVSLGLDPDAISPYTVLARLYYTLRAEITRKGEQLLRATSNGQGINNPGQNGFHWQSSETLLATVREEINKKWKEIEPSPPNSGISYTEVDSLADAIDEILPGSREMLEKSLAQPKAQVDLVMNAWENKDFELARRGLRSILLWDPDRTRLLTAEKAIGAAPQWLARVHKGAGKDEPFYDYLTSVELAGRTIRNQVGPAKWLDQTLEAFKRLRRGTRSVDITLAYPEILHELPWLNEYQSREILSLPHTSPISLERDDRLHPLPTNVEGVVEGKFGPKQAMVLTEALDTWIPEARGSSARVFSGILHHKGKRPQSYAFKIMRSDQLDYALPLFIEEIRILNMIRDVPGVTPLIECGFIKLADGNTLPGEESHASAENLTGQVIHYGVEQAQNYLASMDRQLASGWLPYLALVKRNPEYCLLHYCDISHTHGWFLPLRESLILSIQLCDILQFAHDRNIVYRDHKILHFYWDAESQAVAIIDWNIARHHPQGLSEAEKQFDLVQFGARGLHHIFTGRPAQGSLALGPNRPEDIENASTHYPVSWTFDDERLPNQLRTILETSLNQGYTQVRDIRHDLLGVYQQLPGSDKK